MLEESLYRGPVAPLQISGRGLSGIPERLFLRDPKARSAQPSLARLADGDLAASGPFLIHHEYRIPAARGEEFVRVIGDPNRVHTESGGGVVAGVMTASKLLLPLEVMLPNLDITAFKCKFTAPAYYERRTVNHCRLQHVDEREVEAVVSTYQLGERVALTQVRGRVRERAPAPAQPQRPEGENLDRVEAFCRALNLPAELFFDRRGTADYCYPRSFIASLPSGEFVKQLDGQGGTMNVIQYEFAAGQQIPIHRQHRLEVQLERGRARPTFNRVLTKIIEGLVTYCKGSALLNPHSSFG